MISIQKAFFAFFILISVFANLSGVSFAAKEDSAQANSPKVIAIDTKGAGKPDRWEYYEVGVLTRIEADTNGDGKVDEWAEVKDGKIIGAKKDSNFDGKVDRWISY